jgi:glycosyltransferase involved in cell wall biosynthesis
VKVLHVIAVLGVGGTELQLRSVIQHSRHECEVITLFNPGPVADMLREDGVQVRDLAMTSNKQVSVFPRLLRLMRDGHYDVVHAHHYRSQIYGRPAARVAGIPIVVSTEHSIGETHLDGKHRITPWVRALYLGTELFSDMTIAVSQPVRDRLAEWGVPDHKVTVIPNGVDLGRIAFDLARRKQVRAEFSIGADDYVIGGLGRLDSNKRFDLVLGASVPLLRNGVTLLIIGKGDELPRLEAMARRFGVARRVVFAGERNDVGAMLSAMDLFVASSREETFGLSVVEALANGMPVLYTTSPALDGLDVTRARQVPGTIAGLRDAIAAEVSVGRRERAPEPVVAAKYNIRDIAAQIDDLYERLAARRTLVRSAASARAAQLGAPTCTPSRASPALPETETVTATTPTPSSVRAVGQVLIGDRALERPHATRGNTDAVMAANGHGAFLDNCPGQRDPRQEDQDPACPD